MTGDDQRGGAMRERKLARPTASRAKDAYEARRSSQCHCFANAALVNKVDVAERVANGEVQRRMGEMLKRGGAGSLRPERRCLVGHPPLKQA